MPKIKYFNTKLSKGFISIYSGRMVLRISGALMGLFLPIFLYQTFNNDLKGVIIYYVISSVVYVLTMSLMCRWIMNRIGLKNTLLVSVILGAVYFSIFYFLTQGDFNIKQTYLILLLAALTLTIHRNLYWIPLHTDVAKFTSKKDRGKQLSLIEGTFVLLGAIMPIFAGWILSRHSYDVLFMISIFIYLASLIPFSTIPENKQTYTWTYWRTWKELFSKKRRRAVLAYIGCGAENTFPIFIWPIFIFELLNGNYLQVGALSSLIVVVTVGLQFAAGKFTDKFNKKQMLKFGTIFYSVGWIVKIFIATAFHIFVASAYHSLTRIFITTPFDALTYELAADQGQYVDEFTVIREMSIHIGRIIMCLLIFLSLSFLSLQWTFILAAMSALFFNFLTEEDEQLT